MTHKSIGTNAVFEILIVSHVETRNDRAEIELVQEASILDSLATLPTILALKIAVLVTFILFLVVKLANRSMVSVGTVTSHDTNEKQKNE
jgi:hypothetical protein